MNFQSLAELIAMDGHGAYVWSAYLITLIVVGANIWWPRVVRTAFVKKEQRRVQREVAARQGE